MSKKRRRQESNRPLRDALDITSETLTGPKLSTFSQIYNALVAEDRRSFHPEGRDRYARTKFGTDADFEVPGHYQRRLNHSLQFVAPERVMVCVRRKERREVMFAKGKGGSRRIRRSRRRNNWSDVKCSKR